MSRARVVVASIMAAGLLAFAGVTARAQSQSTLPSSEPQIVIPSEALLGETRVEAYASHHRLTAGFGNWHEVGVRGSQGLGAHLLQAEAATMRRFGESGVFVGLGDTYTFDPDWFASLNVGAGDGASYLPRVRVDSFINRKLLPTRSLVGTLGLAYYRAPDGHIDHSAALAGTYYFEMPLVVQAEVRFNESDPGSVRTHRQFVAVTWGREPRTQVTARYAWGGEGYQSIGAGTTLVNFNSREASLGVRYWVRPAWGISVTADGYRNPFYHRSGANVGLFWRLP